MKMTKCSYGHFYDSEHYAECPECKGMDSYESTITEMILEESTEVTGVSLGDTLKNFLESEGK